MVLLNNEKKLLIEAFNSVKSVLELELHDELSIKIPKSEEASRKAREKGNLLFLKGNHSGQDHAKVFDHYCQSIALAPNDSQQLAFAYGNRAAFLMHIKKYKESIQDIDKALKLTTSRDSFKVKLLCRKAECLKRLHSTEYKNVLSEIDSLNGELHRDEDKSLLHKMLNKVKNILVEDKAVTENKISLVSLITETSNILESVSINYDEKYKRHIIAARDYEPGEIIFCERLYALVLNSKKRFTHCYYCLNICWSGIPCDKCTWAMFCSEGCKVEAWKKFHDIECSVLPNETKYFSLSGQDFLSAYHLCLRMLICGIKEAGSIAQLRNRLEKVDNHKDDRTRGFIKDGKLVENKFESIFSLESNFDTTKGLGFHKPIYSLLILAYLVKNSSFFGKKLEIDDLIKNEDAVFVGCLLIKLFGIRTVNEFGLGNQNPMTCEQLKSPIECSKSHSECCMRGSCLAPFLSLINHSCSPNAARCFVEDQKSVVYALQPIKKNSQIFITYIGYYYNLSKTFRQVNLKLYNFVCDCTACIYDWPTVLDLPEDLEEKYLATMRNSTEKKMFNDCKRILESWTRGSSDFNQESVDILSKAIKTGIEKLEQPSLITCQLLQAFECVFNCAHVPKKQSYGQCRKK